MTSTTNGNYAAPHRTFTDSIKVCFVKYVTFNGRASRSEFWWFYLFTVLCEVTVEVVGYVFLGGTRIAEFLALFVYWLLVFPGLAASARRLHDTNRSGWLLLILLPGLPLEVMRKGSIVDIYTEFFGQYMAVFWLYLLASVCIWLYWMVQKGYPSKNFHNRKIRSSVFIL